MLAERGAPLACSAEVLLPLALLVGSLAMETDLDRPAELAEVAEVPICSLQDRHDGAHHGLVLNLRGLEAGAVWAVWSSGGAPHLVALPDCPGANGDDGCCLYATHPARHSFELYDPLLALAQQAALGFFPH
jgi:hypothetical protein